MKKHMTIRKKMPLILSVVVFVSLFGLFGCAAGQKKTVSSVESMSLVRRGMRGGTEYKIEVDGEKTKILRYREVYADGQINLEPEASAVVDTVEFVELVNNCGVIRWDGFHGKHPKNVHDGEMFRFSACVNGDKTIEADGSANFPKGYNDFVRALDEMLAQHESV
ncbi:MAG: hypothetical protein E7656_10660 [Ruminococcaceae bacterium]|nr:hypothetical protein [Oscillospiraceae bacterium]